jgi:hypothetical protein
VSTANKVKEVEGEQDMAGNRDSETDRRFFTWR